MAFLNFIIYYFIREYCRKRESRRKRRRAVKGGNRLKKVANDDVELQVSGQDAVDSVINVEEYNITTYRRPFICRLVLIWGVLEIIMLLIVLIKKQNDDNPRNFLSSLCNGHEKFCKTAINRMIYYKILISVFLVLGTKFVS